MSNYIKLQILDCTLRDGGYYCDWHFDDDIIQKYLSTVSDAKIDIVEIGFRFIKQKELLGPFAYSTDDYLYSLNLPSGIHYAVMINAGDLISYEEGIYKAVDLLFDKKKNSPVDIVRIAAHAKDADQCKYIAQKLKLLGYRVFLNLMQIDSIEKATLCKIIKQIRSWDCIEVLYFADSFGSMNPDSISDTVNNIKTEWNNEIGLHAHDNKGHALVNSIKAIDCGVGYVDATILGMGRGAGNTKMETLLVEITDRETKEYYPDALYPLVLQDFNRLQKKYNWGSSIYYFLSAVHNIHPTYIQEMLGDGRYANDQILSAIDFLKHKSSSSYSLESMLDAIATSSGNERGSWSANDFAKGKDVLIIGSGPSTKKYIVEIVEYIRNNNPVVLCLNINKDISEDHVSAYVACHETRITIELDSYSDLTKPIILPTGKIPSDIKTLLSNVDILDYGLKIKEADYNTSYHGCTLNKPLVLMYAMSLASVSGANRILLTGVDGYEKYNPKQDEMVAELNQFIKKNADVKVFAITPTTYPIEQLPIKNTILK